MQQSLRVVLTTLMVLYVQLLIVAHQHWNPQKIVQLGFQGDLTIPDFLDKLNGAVEFK